MKRHFALTIILWAFLWSLGAAELRVTLLEQAGALEDTVSLLRQNGSSAASLEAFRKVVRFHNTDGFDRSRFPPERQGFYHFKSVEALNRAIPDPFCEQVVANDLPHNTLTCLDTVVLLIRDTGAGAPRLKDDFATKGFAKYQNRSSADPPDYIINPVTACSFYEDGRTLLYPTNGYTLMTGLTRTPEEVDLAISLKGERLLPGEFENTDAAIRKLFGTWNALREKDGLKFPDTIRVVTCGYIPLRYRYWAIDHVAVVMKSRGKLVYLEKNGPRGPFMRVDFNNEKELGRYVANKLLPASRNPKEINYGAPVFVAINDRLIRIERP